MKKTLSLALVLAMVLSAMAIAIPTSAAATATNIEYYNALQFTTPPTIDGYITEAEWGADEEPIIVEASDCASIDDSTPYSRFFYNRINATDRNDYGAFSYQIWFRWDFKHFYIGVKVNDPDVHALKFGTTNAWNGDAVQVRVDKNGANAASYGADFVWTPEVQKPWSSEQVPDMIFGYVEIAGGFSEAWENTSNKGMTSFSNNPLGITQCVVAPAGSSYSADTQAGYTTYEVAVPWAYIVNGEFTELLPVDYRPGRGQGAKGAYGRELGVSLAVLNDGNDGKSGYDAFMSWGSGICGAHQEQGNRSVTGSNAVTLVETAVVQGNYEKKDPTSLLDAKFSQENIDAPGTFYDYLSYDFSKSNPVGYDDLKALKYDDGANDLSIWGAPEYKGEIKDIGGEHGNVLDYTNRSDDNNTTYIDTRDDKTEYLFPTSYTFEFDIMYTGTNEFAEGYASALYNWFGGATGHAFQCGYFFNEKRFLIVDDNDVNHINPLAKFSFDLKKDNWYNWKFQFDNESCTARLWIDDLSTEADNKESGTAGTAGYTGEWGTLIFNTSWRYFYYSDEKAMTEGTLLLFRQMNTNTAYDNVKMYNFASVTDVYVPGENAGPVAPSPDVEGGDKLETGDANKIDGVWNIPVSVAKQYLSATKLSFTVKFDSAKGTFEGVKGLNEGTYTVEEIAAGEYLITITDFTQVKGLKAGDKFFDILIKSEAETLDELGLDLSDAYTYRNTGDAMIFIVIAALVSILGCAVVIRKRRALND